MTLASRLAYMFVLSARGLRVYVGGFRLAFRNALVLLSQLWVPDYTLSNELDQLVRSRIPWLHG